MRIRYESIGPVDKAEVQLGRLTVICGNNNVGKTYLAYSLYGLLRHINNKDNLGGKTSVFKLDCVKKATVEQLNSNGKVTVELDRKELVRKSLLAIKRLSKEYSDVVHTTFNGEKESFQGSLISIKFEKATIEKHIDNVMQNMKVAVFRNFIKMHYDSVSQELTISKEQLKHDSNNTVTVNELCRAIFKSFIHYPFPRPFITTSQRNGISMFHKDLGLMRHLQIENVVGSKRPALDRDDYEQQRNQVAKHSMPVSDEIYFVRQLGNLSYFNDKLSQDETGSLLEQLVKITSADYEVSDAGINHVSVRKNRKRFDIPLHLASASSVELAELYFYLTRMARKDDLLIIDEPESHLSHINQIYLTRLLSLCVNYGIRVLITTHSDIILKEFNNMFMYDKLPDKLRKQFKDQYKPEMSISPDSLKAYWCIEGEVMPCEVNNWGMNIPNFDDAHFSLHDRAVRLYSLLGDLGYE